MVENKLITKYGSIGVNTNGYYIVRSRKEGNNGKLLHRLIWEDFYNRKIPQGYDIHHINNDKLDNRIQNLQCVEHNKHIQFHKNHLSDETRRKMSENNARHWSNKQKSLDLKMKISRSANTTKYFRVYKQKKSSCKQGFIYCYQYYVDGRQRGIVSVDIEKLKEKVLAKGLEWREFDDL